MYGFHFEALYPFYIFVHTCHCLFITRRLMKTLIIITSVISLMLIIPALLPPPVITCAVFLENNDKITVVLKTTGCKARGATGGVGSWGVRAPSCISYFGSK